MVRTTVSGGTLLSGAGAAAAPEARGVAGGGLLCDSVLRDNGQAGKSQYAGKFG